MSIESVTSIAVARDLRRAPTKSDVGNSTKEASAKDQTLANTEILAKTLPVGLVTAYTAFIAVVSEVVAIPTRGEPNPDQYLVFRWAGYVLLVGAAAFLTYHSYRRKVSSDGTTMPEARTVPWTELSAVTVAAATWGLAIPESPLLASIKDENTGLLLLALIAFVGVVINLALSAQMKEGRIERGQVSTTPPRSEGGAA